MTEQLTSENHVDQGRLVDSLKTELLLFIDIAPLILDEEKQVARKVVADLYRRFIDHVISQEQCQLSLQSLKNLIPIEAMDGSIFIGTKKITLGLEKMIQSRLSAENVHQFSRENPWTHLPDVIKDKIAQEGGLVIELTNSCTGSCSFCGLTKAKGPIGKKFSFKVIQALFSDLYSRGRNRRINLTKYMTDSLYYGTDVFDYQDRDEDGVLHRYIDVYKEYFETVGKLYGKNLYTSTALPIGTELSVLEFVSQLVASELPRPPFEVTENFRFSTTNQNSERVENIRTVLVGLSSQQELSARGIEFSPIRNQHSSKALKSLWEGNPRISDWDIVGPNCVDETIISPTSLEFVFMMGGSEDYPNGEYRDTAAKVYNDGTTVYLLPVRSDLGHKAAVAYRPIQYHLVTVDEHNQQVHNEIIIERDNPHRSLLKIVGVLREYKKQRSDNAFNEMTDADRQKLLQEIEGDIENVATYIDAGNKNNSMVQILFTLEKLKLRTKVAQ